MRLTADFNILARRFGMILGPVASTPQGFGTTRIGDDADREEETDELRA